MSQSATINDAKLITAVQSKEILFNKGHLYYKNLIKKEMAWRSIAKDCSSTVDAVKKRWKNLRDRFVRELRNVGGMDGDQMVVPEDGSTVWDRYEQMQFLRNHVNHKKFGATEPTFTISVKNEPAAQEEDQCTTANNFFDPSPSDHFDQTINFMFTEERGIQPDLNESDDLLNEFLIRKKRESSSSPSNAHKVSDAQLIASIKPRKCLYEKGNANYKNIAEKEKMWKRVAEECGADTVRVVRSRWKQLRDRFGREIKVTADPAKSTWKLYGDMMFIKDHVNVRNCSSIMAISELEVEHPPQFDDNQKAEPEPDDSENSPVVRQLIDTIRSNPILYDQKSVNFTNVPRKELIWADISREMDIDVTTLKVRWGNLQAKFLQELSTSRETNEPSSWPLYDELLFIKDGIVPFMDGKHDLSNPSDPPVPAVSVVLSDNPTMDVVIGGSSIGLIGAKRRLPSVDDDPALETRIVKVLKRIQDEHGDQLNNQEDEYFSRFITEKLKSFPKKVRNDAKSHIFRYLFDLDNSVGEIE